MLVIGGRRWEPSAHLQQRLTRPSRCRCLVLQCSRLAACSASHSLLLATEQWGRRMVMILNTFAPNGETPQLLHSSITEQGPVAQWTRRGGVDAHKRTARQAWTLQKAVSQAPTRALRRTQTKKRCHSATYACARTEQWACCYHVEPVTSRPAQCALARLTPTRSAMRMGRDWPISITDM